MGNVVKKITNTVSSALGTDGGNGGLLGGLASLDKAVGQIPGGWITVGGLAAGGAALAYAPEVMAFASEAGIAPEAAAAQLGIAPVDAATGAAVPFSDFGSAAGYGPGWSSAGFNGGVNAAGAGMAGAGAAGAGAAAGAAGGGMFGGYGPAALLGGANVLSSIYGSTASKNAAQAQIDAASQANQLAYGIYQQNRADQMPWMQAGTGALKQLVAGTQPGGEFTQNFTPADLAAGMDPGYAFRISEGNKALNATAAARGGLISGNAIKAGQDYGQAAASQEYQNAFSRYQTNRANRLNPLQSLAGLGQSAVNTTGAMGTNYANTAGTNITGAGNASAAGTIGTANAISSGITGIGNLYAQNQALNAQSTQNNLLAMLAGQNRSAYQG
jgi:hypothetical protein